MMAKRKTTRFVVEITEDATGKVVKRTRPMSESMAERCADGMAINLDHNRFTITTRAKP